MARSLRAAIGPFEDGIERDGVVAGERGSCEEPAADQVDLVRRWRCVHCSPIAHGLDAWVLVLTPFRHTEPLPELVAQLAQETYSTDLLYHLLQNIHKLEFESRKDVVQIFNNLLRRQIGARFPTVEYLCSKPEVLFAAFDGYANEEIALNTGMILREMLRHEPLAKILLYSEQ